MNNDNLKVPSSSEAREYGSRGGKASAARRSAARRFHEELAKVLDEELGNGMTKGEALIRRLIKDSVSSPKHMKMLLDVLFYYEPKRTEITGPEGRALDLSIEHIDKLYDELRRGENKG